MRKLFGSSGSKQRVFEFKCRSCGELHRGSPSFAEARPQNYLAIPEAERAERANASDDLCWIKPRADDRNGEIEYHIRTTLDVPIDDVSKPFSWGVWVYISRDSFRRYVDTFDQDQSGDSCFGWLSASLPYYARDKRTGLQHLACDVFWGPAGKRPSLKLHACDHELYHDQVNGISWDKAIEIARLAMHIADGAS